MGTETHAPDTSDRRQVPADVGPFLYRRFDDVREEYRTDVALPDRVIHGWGARCTVCKAPRGGRFFMDRSFVMTNCTAGHDPSQILAGLDKRDPGEDDAKPKSRLLSDHILPLTRADLLAKPKPRRFMLHDANTGAGVYVQGKVGMLAAPGGSGKSYALTQLAVAMATGTTWLGVGGWAPLQAGRVLLLLAEEDEEETWRRLFYSAKAQGVTSDEDLDLLARNLDTLALAGFSVALTADDRGGALPETGFAVALRELLKEAVGARRPYVLIILDPLARLAGPDVETDNAAATRWVQVVETMTKAECGGPSAIIAHHTKKKGLADDPDGMDLIRGSSALVNGVRWAARLEQQKRSVDGPDLLTLRIVKANGIPPQVQPLILCRDQAFEGALRVATPGEIDSNDSVREMVRSKLQLIEDHGDRVLAAMEPGRVYSRNDLAKVCGKKSLVLEAVRQLLSNGSVVENKGKLSLREPLGTTKGTGGGNGAEPSGSHPPTPPLRGVGREPLAPRAQNHPELPGTGNQLREPEEKEEENPERYP